MKKYLLTMIFAVLVVLPLGVNADLKFEVPSTVESECEETTNICRSKVPVYASSDAAGGDTIGITSNIKANLSDIGKAVQNIEVISSDNFDLTYDAATKAVSITPSNPSGVTITDKVVVGYIVSVYDKTLGTGADCGFRISMEGMIDVPVEPGDPTNPNTGVELPLIILGIASVAGIGVYFMTRKNTKMYKI